MQEPKKLIMPSLGCPDVSKYELLGKIGQGTFGEVFKAKDRKTGQLVALKKIRMENEKEGFPITALREIRILQLVKNKNIIPLIEICKKKDPRCKLGRADFYLTFPFCDHDLAGILINLSIKIALSESKMIMRQLLEASYFIHSSNIVHRDMKSSNILLTREGTVKLADFGLARSFKKKASEKEPQRLTNRVVTLWYRPPELLLGQRVYGPEIDMWGIGCILAELFTRCPILQGQNEQHQLKLISELCGDITPESYPGVEELDLYNKTEFPKGNKKRIKQWLRPYVRDEHGLDLIEKLLVLDPTKRIDADGALYHLFFWSEPIPCELTSLLSNLNVSNFEYLVAQRRNEEQRKAELQQQQSAKRKTEELQHFRGPMLKKRVHIDGYHDVVF